MKSDFEHYFKEELFAPVEDGFEKCKKPVIAAVNGKTLGGGFELALLADIIVCTENAYFALPEVNLGLIPGMGGTQRLTKIIGPKLANRMIFTGEGFSGKRAAQLNIAILAQNLEEEVKRLATTIASKSVTTLVNAKKAIKGSQDLTLSQGIQFEKAVFYPIMATKGAKEGISAFIEKRKPNFKDL